MSAPTRTIDQHGVRVFLRSANTHAYAADTLWRMATNRKQGTPEANALYAGYCSVERERDADIEHLRTRGGLLHFGCAQIDRVNGEYVLRGAA